MPMLRFGLCWVLLWGNALLFGCAEVRADDEAEPALATINDEEGSVPGSIGPGRSEPDTSMPDTGMPSTPPDEGPEDAASDANVEEAPAATPAPFDPVASLERYEAWQAEIEDIRGRSNVPGVSLVVVEKGSVRHAGGLGIKRQGGADAVSAGTRFRLGSISKPVTAAAVLSLVADGQVDLDAPVAQQLEGFGATPQNWADQITPRQLLNHTAGYPNYPDFFFDIDETEFEANDELHLFLSRYTDRFPMDFEPGTQWAYSNFGYAVLGWLAAHEHGQNFENTMNQRVFSPFGMNGATFVYATATRGDHASGHVLENGSLDVLDYELTNVQAPFASLLVSAQEWGAFMVALLARRDQAPWSEMFRDSLGAGFLVPGQGMGLGLFVSEQPYTVDHSGSVGGFVAYMVMVPHEELGIGIAINSDDETAFEQMMALTTSRFVQ